VTLALHMLAEDITMAQPSAFVMLILLLLLGLAGGVFLVLTWRETSARRSVELAEWARATGYYSNPLARLRPPQPLHRFGEHLRIRNCFVSTINRTLVEFTTDRLPLNPDPTADPATAPPMPPRFHALICPVEADWPAVALRPSSAAAVLSDLLHLPSQAARFGTQRFVVCSDHRATARVLADSRVRGLLPADIGLLLLGRYLVLDFTHRPFDGIEFNRMIAIAEQVIAHLPSVA